jgi:hypothetical protein
LACRTQEHAVGSFLFCRSARVPEVRPEQKPKILCSCPDTICSRLARQNYRGRFACRAPGRALVEARQVGVEARCKAVDSVFRDGNCSRIGHRVDGAKVQRRRRPRIRRVDGRAISHCWAGVLVLSRQAFLANGLNFDLPALACELDSVVAIPVPSYRAAPLYGVMGAANTVAIAAGCAVFFSP